MTARHCFFFCLSIVTLRLIQRPTFVCDDLLCAVLLLDQHGAKSGITGVRVNFCFCKQIHMAKDKIGYKASSEFVKCPRLLFCPLKIYSVLRKVRQRAEGLLAKSWKKRQ